MAFGVYGKHPAKGDFLGHGLPPALQAKLEGWLDTVLAEAREAMGADWQAVWPVAPHLHFWLGEAIWGEPVAGLLAPTQDRVGRRFPLVYLATGAEAPPPPVTDAGQDWRRALSAHAAAVLARTDLDQPADLLAGAPRPDMAEGVATMVAAEFWAARPGPEVGALWQDVAQADHRRAAATRSYWWTEGEEATARPDLPLAELEPPVSAEIEIATAAAPMEQDVWALAGVIVDDEDSPFSGAAPGLFAPPSPAETMTAEPAMVAAIAEPVPLPPPAPRPAQVWAGQGLPPGAVLAWFFKGHAVGDQRDVG